MFANKFLLSKIADEFAFLAPPARGERFTEDEAIELAALIVAMLGGDKAKFQAALERIEAT